MSVPPRDIGDDEVLTQYGQQDVDTEAFHCAPRAVDRDGLSLIAGTLTVEEACQMVHRGRCVEHDKCGVRHTTAGRLRRAGFVLLHTPNKRNPNHVSVTHGVNWDDDAAASFNLCFGRADEDV